jgi:hypothetical protein
MSDNWVGIILAMLGVASLLITVGALRSGVIDAGGLRFERSNQPVRYWVYSMFLLLVGAMLFLNAYDFAF